MKIEIMASIVTYNPDISKLEKTIHSVIDQVEEIFIVDNHSENILQIEDLKEKYEETGFARINIKTNEANNGIAKALNQALSYANENSYIWVLTLDQDSECLPGMVEKMLDYYINNSDKEKIIIISPRYIDKNFDLSIENRIELKSSVSVLTTITSGSLTNVILAHEIGGFKEELFIDHVDNEFCLRAKNAGLSIIQLNDLVLFHEIGYATKHKFLCKTITTSNHSHVRRYYVIRNSIYMLKKYFVKFPVWVLKSIIWDIVILIRIILYESNKIIKIKYIFKGIKDGIVNKMGPLR